MPAEKMKIIVAYASAGSGHRRAAEAVYNYLKENCPKADIAIIDALEKANFFFRLLYTGGYAFLINHALWAWRLGFWITSIRWLNRATKFFNCWINRVNLNSFFGFLTRENPEIIISTHFLPSEIAAHLRNKRKIRSSITTVITDFGVHPFWVVEGTDTYIAACASTKQELIRQKVNAEKIRDTGIPIDLKFSRPYDKKALREKLGIPPDKFTVLVSTGSSSIGAIEDAAVLLCASMQVLVVCAQNKALYSRLRKKACPGIKLFGFVDNIEELMAVSDIIVAKPGGLTISESLSMGLFPIFITAIPGQETKNAQVLAENSVGLILNDVSSLKERISGLLDPDRIKAAKEAIDKLKRPMAVKELCDALCGDSLRASG